ncbi:LysR family transcriptional regulator [uncultured Oscillibacter sp.]|uniref:LysR family transcriptional regulator n=1 Tax=uncultured Oscillibacter sp. TaxID=876091 RepID=UPI00261C7574|nr:LysR family transcriptional regulator [uncultured Oscillibacter sp.]
MQLQQLVYFMTVADEGGFSKAAEKLLATQPNLSKAIRDLERELKVELFCRNNRGAVLTEAGRRLYQHAGTIMDQMAMIENLGKETAPRSLSIASYPSVMMGQLLGRFYRRHPELSLKLTEVRLQKLIEMVESGEADLGFVLFNQMQSKDMRRMLRNSEFFELGSDTWYANLGPAHPLYDREQVTMEELLDYPIVRQPDDYFSNLTFCLEIDGVRLTGFQRVIYTNDGGALISLLRTTDVFRFGTRITAMAFADYGIRTVPIRNCGLKITTGWIQRRRETLSREAQDFVEQLKSLYPAGYGGL